MFGIIRYAIVLLHVFGLNTHCTALDMYVRIRIYVQTSVSKTLLKVVIVQFVGNGYGVNNTIVPWYYVPHYVTTVHVKIRAQMHAQTARHCIWVPHGKYVLINTHQTVCDISSSKSICTCAGLCVLGILRLIRLVNILTRHACMHQILNLNEYIILVSWPNKHARRIIKRTR